MSQSWFSCGMLEHKGKQVGSIYECETFENGEAIIDYHFHSKMSEFYTLEELELIIVEIKKLRKESTKPDFISKHRLYRET